MEWSLQWRQCLMQFVATRMFLLLLYGAWHHWFLFCRQECRYWCLTPVLTIATSCMHSIGSSAMRESTWLCVVWVPQSMERDPHTHSTTHRMRRSRLCWVEPITATTLLTVCIQRGTNNASGHCKWQTVPRYSRSLAKRWPVSQFIEHRLWSLNLARNLVIVEGVNKRVAFHF